MPPGSTRWISGSTVFRNKPVAAQRSVARKTWSRKWIPTPRIPPAERSRLSGPQRRIQSSLKSNDYVNVFTGQHTRSYLINGFVAEKPQNLFNRKQREKKNRLSLYSFTTQMPSFSRRAGIFEVASI